MSYVGNDWQQEAENLIKAESRVPPYNKLVTLKTYISGTSVERQISQLNSEIASGVDAIIVYALSPTALNPTLRNACRRGIKVFDYDVAVTEPCVHHIHIDQYKDGYVMADWLAKHLHGKGQVVMIGGVPGTSVDIERIKGGKAAFAKYPGIKIVANAVGMWDQAVAKTKMGQILASHPDVGGIWVENGCYGAELGVVQAHHKPIPCAGNSSNGHRVMMLPKSQGGMGVASISIGVGVTTGALAFKHAVEALEGKKIPHSIILPFVKGSALVTNKDLKLGVNVFPNKEVGPGFMDDFYHPELPAMAATMHAAKTGYPGK